ncbi:MAG: hydantoinase/oxoprolinase family protein [Proteobacteria bacterium]|nr:hydantoinase/oxoprolinase family protein [Pseudomonadota bacterium]
MKYKLGTDIGGTFTDFMLVSDCGKTRIHKTLSTPDEPSKAVLTGIKEIAELIDIPIKQLVSEIESIVHGTTVATNALLTQKGARTALVTTRGFRDALEMRRGIREEHYNNRFENVKPLIPRHLRFTVDERIDSQGKILTCLDEMDLDPVISTVKEKNIEALAICFMNAYKNSVHEEMALEYLEEKLPDCFITASTDVLPAIRFYERVSTTAVNAFIGPVVSNYLDQLVNHLEELSFNGSFMIMQSNGGIVTPQVVKKKPAISFLSGPAAAPIAGLFYAKKLGFSSCITTDMGGTSFDASIVSDNECLTSSNGEVNRYKIALPSLNIITIGAGGGSIGWIDDGGLLQMGPQSAGAKPGPVCYEKGGTQATSTDANLMLGFLNPDFFAGGRIKLNRDKSCQQISETLANQLGLDPVETAAGMYRIINSNMAQGVRQISVEKGYDPREFLFIVAGGAGSIHAGEICKELEIPLFVVPAVSPIFCAAGMLLGDLKYDFVHSYLSTFSKIKRKEFQKCFNKMLDRGFKILTQQGVENKNIESVAILDMRYAGQFHEVQLNVDLDDIESFRLDGIGKAFAREHQRLYGYALDKSVEIEVINLRVKVTGATNRPELCPQTQESIPLNKAYKGEREVYIPTLQKIRSIPIYDGDAAIFGSTIKGPAVIEKVNTTIFVGYEYDCLVDDLGSFIVYDREIYPEGFKNQVINLNGSNEKI